MAPRAAVLPAFLLLGCFPPGEGLDPPRSKVYFPVGLAVDADQRFLFVVNSDFDLQYNGGTVQSWDLEQVRARVPRYCESDPDCVRDITPGVRDPRDTCSPEAKWCVRRDWPQPCYLFKEQDSRERALYPGRCGYISQTVPQDGGTAILPLGGNEEVVPGRSVRIGAFATDVVIRSRPENVLGWTVTGDAPERLFVPVRGDATLHWLDVDNGMLECGQDGTDDGSCDGRHRAGDSPEEENTRNSGRLAPEPFGLDADENGLSVAVSNQISGTVSLFAHSRKVTTTGGVTTSAIAWDEGPKYMFAETGMPDRPIGIATVPVPLAMPNSGRERLPEFLVTFRNAPVVFLLRVYDDAAAAPRRPYTQRYESERIETNSSGIDSRGIAVDAVHRHAEENKCLTDFGVTRECALAPDFPGCEAAKDPLFQACLVPASATALDVFLANRAPSSLVFGRTQPIVSDSVTTDIPSFWSGIPLDVGPARVYTGDIINLAGERERRIFVLCFDSRRIAIYDPESQVLETEIVTGRGPQAFAMDVATGSMNPNDDHAFAYVGHFLDSYVGVVDLDQRHGALYGAMIATIGKPEPPRASK